MTSRLDAALSDAAMGASPDTVALMRVLIEGTSEAEVLHALSRRIALHGATADHAGVERLRRIETLWGQHPEAWTIVRTVIESVAHDRADATPDAALRYWAGAFDQLAAASPEASVALYSLGSADLLAAATAEVMAMLESWDLIGQNRDVLDLGCGIGRFLVALAPKTRSVLGLDLSSRMVEEARRRCHGLANVRIGQSDGHDLTGITSCSMDLVLASDVFPYLVQGGGDLAAAHLRAFDRILRPHGTAVILNYSYRGDLESDRRDIGRVAAATSLDVIDNGIAPLRLWDGVAFRLRKRG